MVHCQTIGGKNLGKQWYKEWQGWYIFNAIFSSYGHTKIALEMGMSEDEIHQILTGQMDDYPPEESKAIFFAQHYADMKGKPAENT